MIVVTNVVNDTKSGFVLNCSASIVVFAAAGIAACKIKTDFTMVGKGMKYKINAAISGEAIIRIAVVIPIAV